MTQIEKWVPNVFYPNIISSILPYLTRSSQVEDTARFRLKRLVPRPRGVAGASTRGAGMAEPTSTVLDKN